MSGGFTPALLTTMLVDDLISLKGIEFTLPETTKSLIQKTWAMNNRQRKNNPNTSRRRNQKLPHHSHNGSSPDDLLPKYHYPERLPESCKVSPMCFRVRRENLEKLFGGNGGPGRKNRKQSKSAGPKFSEYLGTGFRSMYYNYPYHFDSGRNGRKRKRGRENNQSDLPEAKKRKTSLTEVELFSFFASMNQRNANSVNSTEAKSKRRKKRELYAFKKGIMRFVNQHRTQIVKMNNVDLGFWGGTSFIIDIRGMQFSFHGMQFSFHGVRTLKRWFGKKMVWNRITLLPIAEEVSLLAKEFTVENAIDQNKLEALLAKQPKVPQKTKVEITEVTDGKEEDMAAEVIWENVDMAATPMTEKIDLTSVNQDPKR